MAVKQTVRLGYRDVIQFSLSGVEQDKAFNHCHSLPLPQGVKKEEEEQHVSMKLEVKKDESDDEPTVNCALVQ